MIRLTDQSELERIDLLRERTGLGYAEAKALLDEAQGNVIQSLILHEGRRQKEKVWEGRGQELLDRVKALIREGNVRKILIKKDDEVILSLPVTAGVIGAAVAPQLALLGGLVAVVGRCSIEVERAPKVKETGQNDVGESDAPGRPDIY